MKPSSSYIVSIALLALPLTGSRVTAQPASTLRIVAATSDLGALAMEVGGDRVKVESLTTGVQDPHSVPGKPSYLLKLQHADLVVVAGLELDAGWLTGRHHVASAISQSGNARIQPGASGYFDASQYAEILELPTQPLVRDIHPAGNPHYWLDPENGRRIAQALTERLSRLRPQDSEYFKDRFDQFTQRLSAAEAVWDREMQPYSGRKVITYRRSWSSFLKRFHLVSVGEIEPSPGIPPSRNNTRELVQRMKSEDVRIILVEPYFELRTPRNIARETGAEVVVMPASVGGQKAITDYLKLFDYDVALLASRFASQP